MKQADLAAAWTQWLETPENWEAVVAVVAARKANREVWIHWTENGINVTIESKDE